LAYNENGIAMLLNPSRPTWILLVFGSVIGVAAAITIVATGGPTERLTRTMTFGIYALAIGVLVAEVVSRVIEANAGT
jgi:hypothetical protein